MTVLIAENPAIVTWKTIGMRHPMIVSTNVKIMTMNFTTGGLPMKINCPICGGRFELDEAVKDQTFRRILEIAHKFGSDSRLMFEYVECFRKDRPLSLKMQARMLEELWEIFEKSNFLYNRKLYSIPRALLIEAIKIICNKQMVGLENHNYLKKILVNSQERQEARGERQEELRKQSGHRDLTEASPVDQIMVGAKNLLPLRGKRPHPDPLPPGEGNEEELIRMPPEVAAAIRNIGKKMPGGNSYESD